MKYPRHYYENHNEISQALLWKSQWNIPGIMMVNRFIISPFLLCHFFHSLRFSKRCPNNSSMRGHSSSWRANLDPSHSKKLSKNWSPKDMFHAFFFEYPKASCIGTRAGANPLPSTKSSTLFSDGCECHLISESCSIFSREFIRFLTAVYWNRQSPLSWDENCTLTTKTAFRGLFSRRICPLMIPDPFDTFNFWTMMA